MRSRPRRWIAALGMTLAVVPFGCATPQSNPPADIDFIRGCWVAKVEPGGQVTAFLRLLPDHDTGATLIGAVQAVAGHLVRDRYGLAFRRDGAAAEVKFPNGDGVALTYVAASAPSSGQAAGQAAFESADRRMRLEARALSGDDVAGEGLVLSWTDIGGTTGDLFRGERDGCD